MNPPDFSKAQTHEELNQMAEDWLTESRAWNRFLTSCPISLKSLHFLSVVGNWALGVQLLGIALMGLPMHVSCLFIVAAWVSFGFLVRGRIQDIARNCGGIWVDGDFVVPK